MILAWMHALHHSAACAPETCINNILTFSAVINCVGFGRPATAGVVYIYIYSMHACSTYSTVCIYVYYCSVRAEILKLPWYVKALGLAPRVITSNTGGPVWLSLSLSLYSTVLRNAAIYTCKTPTCEGTSTWRALGSIVFWYSTWGMHILYINIHTCMLMHAHTDTHAFGWIDLTACRNMMHHASNIMSLTQCYAHDTRTHVHTCT